MDKQSLTIKKIGAADVAEVFLGALAGFSVFWLASHQKSPVHRRLPTKRYKNIHYSPHLKIERKDKHYHLHHWTIFGLSYLPLFLARRKRILRSKLLHGFFLGTILQGLTYKDRFKFVKQPQDYADIEVEK